MVTRCHLLSLVVPLVVTRCTTRLPFYKRSFDRALFLGFNWIKKGLTFFNWITNLIKKGCDIVFI